MREAPVLSLAWLRPRLGRTWILALFGAAYAVSQLTILIALGPLGGEVLELQCLGFSAERTLAILREWERSGAMTAYRAHFVFDDVHWVWYAGLFTALLCRLFEARGISHRFDGVLLLPLASGLLDAYENHLQQLYLDSPGFAAVVDPLPLLGTLASLGKWALVLGYTAVAVALLARGRPRAVRPPV